MKLGLLGKHEHARNMHLTFASLGGGLLLGLLLFNLQPVIDGKLRADLLLVIRVAVWLALFWRLYWVYVNSLTQLLPFNNAWIWGIDMLCFLGGGSCAFTVLHPMMFLVALTMTIGICYARLVVTQFVRKSDTDEERHTYDQITKQWRVWIPLMGWSAVGLAVVTLLSFCADIAIYAHVMVLVMAIVIASNRIEPLCGP